MKTWTIVGLFDLVFFPFCIRKFLIITKYLTWSYLINFLSSFYFLVVSANSKLDNLIENSKKKAPEALVCHVCHSENRQERECLNFTQFGDEFNGFPEQCDMEATSCMVSDFYQRNSTSVQTDFTTQWIYFMCPGEKICIYIDKWNNNIAYEDYRCKT